MLRQSYKAMQRVFVYGSLRRGQPNYYLLKDSATFVGLGRTVKKWPLVIATCYNVPYLLPVEGQGNQISGDLFDVDQATLEKLDELEGHPGYYRRTTEAVHMITDSSLQPLEQQTVQCDMYFLWNFHPKLLDLPYIECFDTKSKQDKRNKYVPPWERPKDSTYSVKQEVLKA